MALIVGPYGMALQALIVWPSWHGLALPCKCPYNMALHCLAGPYTKALMA